MITNVHQMSCGNCGNGTFRIYRDEEKAQFEIMIECNKCKSTSKVHPEIRPQLIIGWGEQSDGIICQMNEISAV